MRNVRAGPGVRRPRVRELAGFSLAQASSSSRRRRRVLDLGRVVLEQRAGRVVGDDDALVLGLLLHLGRGLEVGRVEAARRSRAAPSATGPARCPPRGRRCRSARGRCRAGPAFCWALTLPASSGAVAVVKVTRRAAFGFSSRYFSIAVLGELQVAGDVEDVERHRLVRQLRRLRGRGLDALAASAAAAAGPSPQAPSASAAAIAATVAAHLCPVLPWCLLLPARGLHDRAPPARGGCSTGRIGRWTGRGSYQQFRLQLVLLALAARLRGRSSRAGGRPPRGRPRPPGPRRSSAAGTPCRRSGCRRSRRR